MRHSPPAAVDTDRNLLFGVLALQVDAISRSQFIEGCAAWATEKRQALADVLVQRGWLAEADRADVERLLERKLRKHEGDARSSLAELTSDGLSATLNRVDDPEIHRSVAELHRTIRSHGGPVATVAAPQGGLDRYALTRLHSKGGIGQVWLAHDSDLGRDVALKELLPESRDHPVLVARFLEEARITGQLEHPAIVPVYELAQSGRDQRPFYTMRFIRGRTLSDAVRVYHGKRKRGEAQALDMRELLGALVAVCNAMAYAHSRGVIHRDIKGQNILLGDFGEVVVLDWGLAKVMSPANKNVQPAPSGDPFETVVGNATNDSGDGQAPSKLGSGVRDLTMQGQVLGTPAFMAPEQAEGRLNDLDQRTDVYGLGALLYLILTGHAPFEHESTEAILERVIREAPTPPRQRVPSTPAALEAICLKALAKKPEERYPTAAALARDMQHFLADEPVSAYAEPMVVRWGRWGRQHKALLAAAAALLISTVFGLGIGMVALGQASARVHAERDRAQANFVEAEHQRQEAEHQRQLAEANLRHAQDAEQRARKSAATAQAINKFLVNDLLGEADPDKNAREKKVTVEEALSRAEQKIDKALGDQPEIAASVRATVGETYYRLGRYDVAIQDMRQALATRKRVLGPEHPDTLEVQTRLSEVLWASGKSDEALVLGQQALEGMRKVLGTDDDRTLTALNNLTLNMQRIGKLAECEPLCRESLAIRRRVKGPEHAYTCNAMNNLARVVQEEGRLAEALELQRPAYVICRRVMGPENTVTSATQINLGWVLMDLGRLDEAETVLREAIEIVRRVQGPEHPYTLIGKIRLGQVLQQKGKWDEADPLGRQSWEQCKRVFGPEHPKTLLAMDNLALVLAGEGKRQEAEPLFRESLRIRRKVLPAGHYELPISLDRLGAFLTETGRAAEAEPLLREGLKIRQQVFPANHYLTAQVQANLGVALTALGKYEEAESALTGSYELLKTSPGAIPRRRREVIGRLIDLYTRWGKPAQAKAWHEEFTKARDVTVL